MTVYQYHKKSAPWLVVFAVIAIVTGGCAQKKDVKKDVFFDKWKIMAESSRGYSPSSQKSTEKPPVMKRSENSFQAKPPQVIPPVETEKLLPTAPVSMKMHDIDVTVLLRALAKAADQNIMINEKVKGKANINISKAPWDQVFKGLLRTHGLTFRWEGDIIRIMTLEDMEQDFKRESQKKDFRLVEPPVTRVVKINYSEAAKLKTNLEKFLSLNSEGKPIGSIMVDEHTNSLIIQAIQADIDSILPIIDQLDRPTPQILIEAHIVEATKATARELGIQWGGLSKNGFWITPGANSSGLGGTVDTAINPLSGVAANFPAPSPLKDGIGLTIGFAVQDIGSSIISAQLSALQKEDKVNILSSPSITTLDNQKAIIESGEDVPYTTFEDNQAKVEYKKAVLSLEVIPHVIDGKTLRLNIKTKKDEVTDRKVQENPIITTKFAETNVLLFDGQTTVIGGLNKENRSKIESGVPNLKDIPLLGWLFKNTGNSERMDDLLIFITPHILKERPIEEAIQTKPAAEPPPVVKPDTVPQ